MDDFAGVAGVGGGLVFTIAIGVQRLSKDVRHGFRRLEQKISREFARQREHQRDQTLNQLLARAQTQRAETQDDEPE